MQEQEVIELKGMMFNSLVISDENSKATVLADLKKNQKKIEDLLVSYHFRERGRVYDVQIDDNSLTQFSEQKLQFRVLYKIGHFNACADKDTSETAGMKIILEVDQEEGRAQLIGEYIPEREPDEL